MVFLRGFFRRKLAPPGSSRWSSGLFTTSQVSGHLVLFRVTGDGGRGISASQRDERPTTIEIGVCVVWGGSRRSTVQRKGGAARSAAGSAESCAPPGRARRGRVLIDTRPVPGQELGLIPLVVAEGRSRAIRNTGWASIPIRGTAQSPFPAGNCPCCYRTALIKSVVPSRQLRSVEICITRFFLTAVIPELCFSTRPMLLPDRNSYPAACCLNATSHQLERSESMPKARTVGIASVIASILLMVVVFFNVVKL